VAEPPAENAAAAETAELPTKPFEAVADLATGERTYYVSLSGRGGNSGLSEDAPLPGLDAVPWADLQAGDSVLLKKGDKFPGSIRLVDVHGTADAPITIGAYGDGAAAPVIEARGQGIWLQETGSTNSTGAYASSGVLLYGCSYVTVSGLDIVNRPDELKATWETVISGKSNCDSIAYSGVAVVADGGGPWPVPRFGYDQIEELTDHIMEHRNELTHFDARGRARMVDVGDKEPTRRTAVADLENYDLSRYPIPRADSVPEALREVVDHPIFPGEELSQEAVQRRAYTLEDAGDSQGPRMSFGVRYGDMVVELTAKGVDPGWVYGQLATLPGSADQT